MNYKHFDNNSRTATKVVGGGFNSGKKDLIPAAKG